MVRGTLGRGALRAPLAGVDPRPNAGTQACAQERD